MKGYHQIPVHKNDVKKTAIATPFGLFEFLRMPFGLKNAAQTFQCLMDEVTQDLPGVLVYLDDVLIASRTVEDHVGHLRGLCQALKRFGLVVNQAKCVLGVDQIEFLGHKVTRHGIEPPTRQSESYNVISDTQNGEGPTEISGDGKFL